MKTATIIAETFVEGLKQLRCECGWQTGFCLIREGEVYQCKGCHEDTRATKKKETTDE